MERSRNGRREAVWRFVLRAGIAGGCAVCLLCLCVCFLWYFRADHIFSGKEELQVSEENEAEEQGQKQAYAKRSVPEEPGENRLMKREEQERREYFLYQEYCRRLEGISEVSAIEETGFSVIQEHVFSMETEAFGTVLLIPALDGQYHRLVLFFADEEGKIVYRMEDLETNRRRPGKAGQLTQGIAAISFQDMNADGLTDILLITFCNNTLTQTEVSGSEEAEEETAGRHYKLGDVLFQDKDGFYRDVRISDKLNRFSMNKSIQLIASFVRDGYSAEFLYTSSTYRMRTAWWKPSRG